MKTFQFWFLGAASTSVSAGPFRCGLGGLRTSSHEYKLGQGDVTAEPRFSFEARSNRESQDFAAKKYKVNSFFSTRIYEEICGWHACGSLFTASILQLQTGTAVAPRPIKIKRMRVAAHPPPPPKVLCTSHAWAESRRGVKIYTKTGDGGESSLFTGVHLTLRPAGFAIAWS
jgi:hypothetical protein